MECFHAPNQVHRRRPRVLPRSALVQKLFLMSTVGNMPHISRNEVSVSPRHGVRPLKLLFLPQKTPSKVQKHHKFQLSFYEISQLIRSDPGLPACGLGPLSPPCLFSLLPTDRPFTRAPAGSVPHHSSWLATAGERIRKISLKVMMVGKVRL
jgi:hypothetical protein